MDCQMASSLVITHYLTASYSRLASWEGRCGMLACLDKGGVCDGESEVRLHIACRRMTSSFVLGGILAVLLHVLAMRTSHLLVRDMIWLSQKKSQMHGFRYILQHHRRLDGTLGGGTYRENAVVLHKDRRRLADGADYFAPYFFASDFSISAHGDRASKLISDRC